MKRVAAGVLENKKCSFEREVRSKKKRKNPRAGVAAEIKKKGEGVGERRN